MAEDNIDDILVRLDEIEKLQAELRHLVPRVTNSSSKHTRHQDLSRDSPASIRFPSLFTFPVISNFTSTPRNERLQKSTARLNLTNKTSSGNRHSTVNLKNTGGCSSQSKARETNVFKNLLKSNSNANSQARNFLASTSTVGSRASTSSSIANRMTKEPREAIKKRLKSETPKTASRDKTQRVADERSNVQLSESENVNSIRSSVQTSDIRVNGIEATRLQGAHLKNWE
ncbi:uncharacterized protein LOC114253987 isoform X2 [Monomorium pharaonis]|uniref:uncharacterized protein LOC114253987 isoform X2 n=1 Tax=Monomorium pharaonis TaxID=307658 RepID=UPI001747B12F|nr:uncharacterized protein LOC114253987 isoform X2 [Monomorium pharaonis]